MLQGLVLQRFVLLAEPETAERRIRIPAGMPEVMTTSAVPRPFRSGRWSPCAFSARADTVRIRVSTPRMIVKAARSFRCAFIYGFLFTRVNKDHWACVYFNPAIPSKIAPTCRKKENFRMVSEIPARWNGYEIMESGNPLTSRETEILNNCELSCCYGDPL
jgi:hypothetical protein